MQDQLPDVLHSAGLTPHEVGWLQLHAEPVLRGADGRAVAELWLQAAVDPPGSGRMEVVDAATGAAVGEAPLPPVNRGAAIRWRIPLQLQEATTSLRFLIQAPIPEGSERIRSPWKLLDTIELVLPDDEEPRAGLGLAVPLATAGTRAAGRRPSGMKVHPARARPRDLVSDVVAASPEESFSPAIETLWMPGEPLDGEALRQRLRAHRPSGPTCPACGAMLVSGAEFCPRCLGPVAAAAATSVAGPASEPEPASAPESPPSPPPLDPEAVRCGLHPERASTGTCHRCGSFFCEACAAADSPGLCAACETKLSSPQAVGPQLYRDAAMIYELVAGVLVVSWMGFTFLGLYWPPPVLTLMAFAGSSVLLRTVPRPGILVAAMVVDVLVLLDGFLSGNWILLALAALALALTAMVRQRLSALRSAASSASPGGGSAQP